MSCRVPRDIGKPKSTKKAEGQEPILSQAELLRRIADGKKEREARNARLAEKNAAGVAPIKKGEKHQGTILVRPSRIIEGSGKKVGSIVMSAMAREVK